MTSFLRPGGRYHDSTRIDCPLYLSSASMAYPGTRVCSRMISTARSMMIATPPAPLTAPEAMMVAAGNRFSQTARSAVSQWVSCRRRAIFPASNHLRMRCFLKTFWTECASTSHLAFQETNPGPAAPLLCLSGLIRSPGECSAIELAHVAPLGIRKCFMKDGPQGSW